MARRVGGPEFEHGQVVHVPEPLPQEHSAPPTPHGPTPHEAPFAPPVEINRPISVAPHESPTAPPTLAAPHMTEPPPLLHTDSFQGSPRPESPSAPESPLFPQLPYHPAEAPVSKDAQQMAVAAAALAGFHTVTIPAYDSNSPAHDFLDASSVRKGVLADKEGMQKLDEHTTRKELVDHINGIVSQGADRETTLAQISSLKHLPEYAQYGDFIDSMRDFQNKKIQWQKEQELRIGYSSHAAVGNMRKDDVESAVQQTLAEDNQLSDEQVKQTLTLPKGVSYLPGAQGKVLSADDVQIKQDAITRSIGDDANEIAHIQESLSGVDEQPTMLGKFLDYIGLGSMSEEKANQLSGMAFYFSKMFTSQKQRLELVNEQANFVIEALQAKIQDLSAEAQGPDAGSDLDALARQSQIQDLYRQIEQAKKLITSEDTMNALTSAIQSLQKFRNGKEGTIEQRAANLQAQIAKEGASTELLRQIAAGGDKARNSELVSRALAIPDGQRAQAIQDVATNGVSRVLENVAGPSPEVLAQQRASAVKEKMESVYGKTPERQQAFKDVQQRVEVYVDATPADRGEFLNAVGLDAATVAKASSQQKEEQGLAKSQLESLKRQQVALDEHVGEVQTHEEEVKRLSILRDAFAAKKDDLKKQLEAVSGSFASATEEFNEAVGELTKFYRRTAVDPEIKSQEKARLSSLIDDVAEQVVELGNQGLSSDDPRVQNLNARLQDLNGQLRQLDMPSVGPFPVSDADKKSLNVASLDAAASAKATLDKQAANKDLASMSTDPNGFAKLISDGLQIDASKNGDIQNKSLLTSLQTRSELLQSYVDELQTAWAEISKKAYTTDAAKAAAAQAKLSIQSELEQSQRELQVIEDVVQGSDDVKKTFTQNASALTEQVNQAESWLRDINGQLMSKGDQIAYAKKQANLAGYQVLSRNLDILNTQATGLARERAQLEGMRSKLVNTRINELTASLQSKDLSDAQRKQITDELSQLIKIQDMSAGTVEGLLAGEASKKLGEISDRLIEIGGQQEQNSADFRRTLAQLQDYDRNLRSQPEYRGGILLAGNPYPDGIMDQMTWAAQQAVARFGVRAENLYISAATFARDRQWALNGMSSLSDLTTQAKGTIGDAIVAFKGLFKKDDSTSKQILKDLGIIVDDEPSALNKVKIAFANLMKWAMEHPKDAASIAGDLAHTCAILSRSSDATLASDARNFAAAILQRKTAEDHVTDALLGKRTQIYGGEKEEQAIPPWALALIQGFSYIPDIAGAAQGAQGQGFAAKAFTTVAGVVGLGDIANKVVGAVAGAAQTEAERFAADQVQRDHEVIASALLKGVHSYQVSGDFSAALADVGKVVLQRQLIQDAGTITRDQYEGGFTNVLQRKWQEFTIWLAKAPFIEKLVRGATYGVSIVLGAAAAAAAVFFTGGLALIPMIIASVIGAGVGARVGYVANRGMDLIAFKDTQKAIEDEITRIRMDKIFEGFPKPELTPVGADPEETKTAAAQLKQYLEQMPPEQASVIFSPDASPAAKDKLTQEYLKSRIDGQTEQALAAVPKNIPQQDRANAEEAFRRLRDSGQLPKNETFESYLSEQLRAGYNRAVAVRTSALSQPRVRAQ